MSSGLHDRYDVCSLGEAKEPAMFPRRTGRLRLSSSLTCWQTGAKSRTSGKHRTSAPSNSCTRAGGRHWFITVFFVPFFSWYKFLWQEVESAMAADDNTITEPITILQYLWPFDRTNIISRPPVFFFCNQQPALKDFFTALDSSVLLSQLHKTPPTVKNCRRGSFLDWCGKTTACGG